MTIGFNSYFAYTQASSSGAFAISGSSSSGCDTGYSYTNPFNYNNSAVNDPYLNAYNNYSACNQYINGNDLYSNYGGFRGRSTSAADELTMFGRNDGSSISGGNLLSMGAGLALLGTPLAPLGLINLISGGKLFQQLGKGLKELTGGIGQLLGGIIGGVGKALGNIGKGIGKLLSKL